MLNTQRGIDTHSRHHTVVYLQYYCRYLGGIPPTASARSCWHCAKPECAVSVAVARAVASTHNYVLMLVRHGYGARAECPSA